MCCILDSTIHASQHRGDSHCSLPPHMDPGKLCHQLCGKSTLHSHVVFLFDFRGFAKKKNHEITMEVGGSRSHSEFCFVLENRPKIALNQY